MSEICHSGKTGEDMSKHSEIMDDDASASAQHRAWGDLASMTDSEDDGEGARQIHHDRHCTLLPIYSENT